MPELIKPDHKILRPEVLPEQPVKPEGEGQAKSLEKVQEGVIKIDASENLAPSSVTTEPSANLTPLAKKVEQVLEEDLTDIFLSLPADKQQEFKQAGEVAAQKISRLMQKVRFNLRQIIKIIRDWLSVIPGVNKYFLEQTAKIKADKIIKLH